MQEHIEIFISYAHKDEVLRQKLEQSLSTLKRQGFISIWHDREISPGIEWKHEIDEHLMTAHIILLLVSPAFLASEYCYSIEMQKAFGRHKRREARVVPIILRPALWQETPLGELQALPTDGKPVTDRSWHSLDRAYLDVVKGIQRVVEELRRSDQANIPSDIPLYRVMHPDSNAEFVPIKLSDLRSVPLIVQALDNHWMPRTLWHAMQMKGYLTENIERQRVQYARSDYIRALINGQQVVINLPYIYNNPVLYQDYIQRGPKQQAFSSLLESGVIVPYLSTEKNPAEHSAQTFYDMDYYGFGAWRQLCLEVPMQCLRLSWDDKINEKLTERHLYGRFQRFALGAASGDIDTYIQDLRLDQQEKRSFHKLLAKMGLLCLDMTTQGKQVTRTDLYKVFVTTGDNPADRRYDTEKPFAGEIKQLLDLAYNCHLADSLGGYLLTPVDSLPRTALQEWQRSFHQPTITAKELLALLQRTSFDLVQRSLNVSSMNILQLPDVRAIRETEEWMLYMQNLQALLKHPEQFADGLASGVYQSYTTLAQRITGRINWQSGKGSLLTSWTPTVELVFNIAGAILSYRLTDDRKRPQWRLRGNVAELIVGETAPVVGKFMIRDLAEEHAQQDLSTGIDFMHFQIPDVQEQWKEIKMGVRRLPGFQETSTEPEEADSTISYKEPLEQ